MKYIVALLLLLSILLTGCSNDPLVIKIGDEVFFTNSEVTSANFSQTECVEDTCKVYALMKLNDKAASRHASITSKLDESNIYLSQKISIEYKGDLIDELLISKELKGEELHEFILSGIMNQTTALELQGLFS